MAAPTSPFDRALLRRRLARAVAGGAYPDFLLRRAAEDLSDRLSAVTRRFELGIDLGTPLDVARAPMLASCERVVRLAPSLGVTSSLTGPSPPSYPEALGGAEPQRTQNGPACFEAGLRPAPQHEGAGVGRPVRPGPDLVGDEETLPFVDGSAGLVVSLLSLQAVNDLPGTLAQVRRVLAPDGLFLACLLGGDSLRELRAAFAAAEAELEGGVSPRVAPFADVRGLGALLQRAGLALPVADLDRAVVRYDTAFGLFADLRAMGAANALHERRRTPLRRSTLLRAAAIYAERFSDPDGRVRATFDLVWLSGWAPHESQQKPLKPGSARARLADALGVPELGLAAGDVP